MVLDSRQIDRSSIDRLNAMIRLLRRRRYLNLAPDPRSRAGTLSSRRINFLLNLANGPTNYLEIGLYRGETFEAVASDFKVGVDPNPRFFCFGVPSEVKIHRTTSREFFRQPGNQTFDVIFLDGLHESSETLADLVQALGCLRSGGFVVVDDVLPSDEQSSLPDEAQSRREKLASGISHDRWYGDVWKVAEIVRTRSTGLEATLVGDGVTEHTQLVARKISEGNFFSSPLDELVALMATMRFSEIVDNPERGLRAAALEEIFALQAIADSY